MQQHVDTSARMPISPRGPKRLAGSALLLVLPSLDATALTLPQSPNAHGFDYFFGFKSGFIDYYMHTGGSGEADLFENETDNGGNGCRGTSRCSIGSRRSGKAAAGSRRLWRWPGRIPSGRVSDQVGITMDLATSIPAATSTLRPTALVSTE